LTSAGSCAQFALQPISAQGSFHGDITLAYHPALLPDAVGVAGHPPCVLAWPDSGSTGPGQGYHLTVIRATPRSMPNAVLSEWHAVDSLCTGSASSAVRCRAVGAWSAVELVISYELLMMIIRGAQAPGNSGGYC
jgi:hypothetical protein